MAAVTKCVEIVCYFHRVWKRKCDRIIDSIRSSAMILSRRSCASRTVQSRSTAARATATSGSKQATAPVGRRESLAAMASVPLILPQIFAPQAAMAIQGLTAGRVPGEIEPPLSCSILLVRLAGVMSLPFTYYHTNEYRYASE